MSDDPWARLQSRPCRCLRSKEMFYDNGTPLEERGGSGIFWCSQTHNCMGPDGRIVSLEECVSTRPCHER
jgi:hypothetical protein